MRLPAWDEGYPDPAVVRGEVEAMVAAVAESLLEALGEGMQDLWFKGSAYKPWDTPIDYVPEISDVDLHIRVDGSAGTVLADLERGLALHAAISRRFFDRVADPLHIPRPQFVNVDQVATLPGYVPPPPNAVRVLFGVGGEALGKFDQEAVRRADAAALTMAADPTVLERAVFDLVELPAHHLRWAIRGLNGRVSPVAPRCLSILGVDYITAWTVNRTQAVALLEEFGQHELAHHYADYYRAGWEFFLSGWQDVGAGRRAFQAAVTTLKLGAALVKTA